jgi:hypothetical protein
VIFFEEGRRILSVQVDPYLPMLAPPKVKVFNLEPSSYRDQKHNLLNILQQRVWRIPHPQQTQATCYGCDGRMEAVGATGRLIDLYL